ncbi:MAG: hypothetical protein OEQ53_09390 [Saprospiraceae bacterium]|nr:hypothetical protein [Saprospiraceae bacterium]
MMKYLENTAFHRLLATKYDEDKEQEAIDILLDHPELAVLEWPGPDRQGTPFVKGSTALHYASNDGKMRLVAHLIDLGADVNAANANWFRSVLSWSANNARIDTIKYLLNHGADASSLDAMHAAAWGGSNNGRGEEEEYLTALRLLLDAGADLNDRRHFKKHTPLAAALESKHHAAIDYLRSLGASEV